ncbi:hypothetical protein BH09MYX1_BH09MYX1_50430 [soil metagenome]
MGKVWIVGLLLVTAVAVACGGNKAPLVPDGPEMNVPEAGVDDPASSASASPSVTPPAAPAK